MVRYMEYSLKIYRYTGIPENTGAMTSVRVEELLDI